MRVSTRKRSSSALQDCYIDPDDVEGLGSDVERGDEEPAAPQQQQRKRRRVSQARRAASQDASENEDGDQAVQEDLPGDVEARQIDGDWTEKERQAHVQRLHSSKKTSTTKQYAPYIANFKIWCAENEGSDDLSSIKDAAKAGRFMVAWCEENWMARGCTKPPRGRLSPEGCMQVHAALASWANECCLRQGKPTFSLRDDSGYAATYQDLVKGRRAGRKNLGAVQFTKDNYVTVCQELYRSGDAKAPQTRLMLTLSVSTVSRGDEIRDVRMSSFSPDVNDKIGPATCVTLRFELSGHKTFKGHPEQKAFIRGR